MRNPYNNIVNRRIAIHFLGDALLHIYLEAILNKGKGGLLFYCVSFFFYLVMLLYVQFYYFYLMLKDIFHYLHYDLQLENAHEHFINGEYKTQIQWKITLLLLTI